NKNIIDNKNVTDNKNDNQTEDKEDNTTEFLPITSYFNFCKDFLKKVQT
ncbi:22787_t:CDS:1, partial [Cetraspora pellucida]